MNESRVVGVLDKITTNWRRGNYESLLLKQAEFRGALAMLQCDLPKDAGELRAGVVRNAGRLDMLEDSFVRTTLRMIDGKSPVEPAPTPNIEAAALCASLCETIPGAEAEDQLGR